MKKIILILISCMMLIATLVIGVSAYDDVNVHSHIEWDNTKKAYPIYNDEAYAIGFFEYYGSKNFTFDLVADKEYNEFQLSLYGENGKVTINSFTFNGDYPTWSYELENPTLYTDIAIINKDDHYYLYGCKEGVFEEIYDLHSVDFGGSGVEVSFERYCKTELSEGYYFEYPSDTTEDSSIDNLPLGLINVTVTTLGGFVGGIGSAFNSAFTSLFIVNGMLNSLAIFVLVLGGIGLGYGIVRFVTGLFRKKGE